MEKSIEIQLFRRQVFKGIPCLKFKEAEIKVVKNCRLTQKQQIKGEEKLQEDSY